MTDRSTIFLDGDDTLWSTQPLYDNAKEAFYQLVAEAGLSEADARAEFDALDLANVERLGFSSERFPTSMREMVVHLLDRVGRPHDEALEAAAEQIGRSVFGHTPVLDPDAPSVLSSLSSTHELILYTMGDPLVQQRRVEDLGLRSLVDRVIIPHVKTAEALQEVVGALGLDPSATWFVGNSLRSDIEPACAVGLRPVWLVRKTWAYDHRPTPPPGVPVIHSLSELPALLAVSTPSA